MTDYKKRFQHIFRQLFQFEAADLDFGIYRIMNFKRKQIDKFIQQDIEEIVDQDFARYRDERMVDINQRLEEAKAKVIQALNKDVFLPSGDLKEEFKGFSVAKAYQELKDRKDDVDATNEVKMFVYNDLYNFFSRYYDEGDFAPRYRYSIKGHKYAIPYNGEEVKLYWATSDQYYIKTGILFRDYAFFADNSKTYKIIFRTVAAKEELGSNKATKARFFVLDDEKHLEMSGDSTLVIRLQYRELTAAEVKRYEAVGGSNTSKQDKINQHVMDAVFEGLGNPHLKGFLRVCSKNDKPLLLNQLSRFTAKNNRDFFIHKNLKKFLSEQLDYFIKSEVISIETLERERFLDRHITRAKVVREIAGRIIDFLAQIEDFQKKLWEKKKFVLKTEYVITTDRIPDEFYPEILKNKKQGAEWQALGFGKAPSKAGLKEKKLPIDTRHFPEDFKERLLEKLTEAADLDDLLDGLMIKSENWQGLNLLREKYRERVKCVYIDPPYNTGSDEFVYRDDYQHSSWLTMMENRLYVAKIFLQSDGLVFIHIDEREQARLEYLLQEILGEGNSLGPFIWHARAGKAVTERMLQIVHEYIVCGCKSKANATIQLVEKKVTKCRYSDERGGYNREQLRQWGGQHDRREDRPTLYFPITTPFAVDVYPRKPDGSDGCWRASREQVDKMLLAGDLDFVKDENTDDITVYRKIREGTITVSAPSNVINDCGTSATATTEIKNLFLDKIFDTAKPVALAKRFVSLVADGVDSSILDFFPGSGTTAHAVMNLNREDGGRRKFILIEMANYFDTVMIPRIKKVAYSFSWKDGKPKDSDGNGVFFKYQFLEQYEDTLDNLELKENQDALSLFGNDYLLKYFLNFESRDNASLVNFEHFKKPFSYKLKVNLEEVGEPDEVIVDLPETFHYLLGLKVKKIKVRKDKGRKYLFILGEKGGRNIAVVWRGYDDDWTKAAFQKDKRFIIQEIQDWAPSVVYVNGQSALTPKIGSHTAEVRAIEPEFRKHMVDPS